MTSLIINSPYSAPSKHWKFTEEGAPLKRVSGRREAGYMIADPTAKPYQDRGIFVSLDTVNHIRPRVDTWREAGYPGVTGITRTLLGHWNNADHQRSLPFFFCQIEAIETLIWFIEASETERVGIEIPSDKGLHRLCSKLATGTGKTVVMAMLIAWQAINRATYPQDTRFSKNIFIVAPNLTVRERLSVLKPDNSQNYYDEFDIVPVALREKLWQAAVLIRNWHTLSWESEKKIQKKKGVDKRGAKSDEAYTREVLGDMANARNLIVINDEAHHAWRVPAESKVAGVKKEDIEEATKWVGGLDRINETRGILRCFDFSATPFAPSGKKTSKEALFPWIVSDFGLNDAIESGLVKTPRVVVDEDALPDARTYKPRLYHIYSDKDVKEDLNRKTEPNEHLPDLVMNAYKLLGSDWLKAKKEWEKQPTPPVMITVANQTYTAARIKYAFDNQHIMTDSLNDPKGILHIDSSVLKKAEEKEPEQAKEDEKDNEERKTTKKEQAELLREKVNTVGQEGKPGEQIQNVISVGMLSEGWDARTVTHIMGLRAFTSQLLCEQVIGRGLRRASYDINEKTKLFDAEYVNVFGVPFSFLPHEYTGNSAPPPQPKTVIQPIDEKKKFEVSWPNILRIDRTYKPTLSINWDEVRVLEIDTSKTVEIADIAPVVNGQPDVSKVTDINLEELMKKFRKQTLVFKAAQTVWQEKNPEQPASAPAFAQLVSLAEQFLDSDRIQIIPALYNQEPQRKHAVIVLNMAKVIRHFWQAIAFNNTDKKSLVLDSNYPIRKTGDMRPWRTGKPYKPAKKSHINHCVLDSAWEKSPSYEFDKNKVVEAWAKNDHLGFGILYIHNGVVKKYYPDFLARMTSGEILVLEVKGQQTDKDDTKHTYMEEWIEAVNENGGFGKWNFAVSTTPADIKDILHKYTN